MENFGFKRFVAINNYLYSSPKENTNKEEFSVPQLG